MTVIPCFPVTKNVEQAARLLRFLRETGEFPSKTQASRMCYGVEGIMLMSSTHPASLTDEKLLRDCSERRTRRSGPGGQHRNKVETAVVLKHETTGIEAEANERRSQLENRRVALFRLRIKLALEVRGDRSPESSPSNLWRTRCRNGRISLNPEHTDFPAILAEALDALATHDFDLSAAATALNCTSSQLVKLLKDEPRAFALLNRERTARELPRLK